MSFVSRSFEPRKARPYAPRPCADRGGESAGSGRQTCGIQYARVAEWLRRRWPERTAVNAAASLGASHRTVERWLSGETTPSFLWTARMIAAFGPDFLAALYESPADWLIRAQVEEERERLAREMERLARRQAALEAKFKN